MTQLEVIQQVIEVRCESVVLFLNSCSLGGAQLQTKMKVTDLDVMTLQE